MFFQKLCLLILVETLYFSFSLWCSFKLFYLFLRCQKSLCFYFVFFSCTIEFNIRVYTLIILIAVSDFTTCCNLFKRTMNKFIKVCEDRLIRNETICFVIYPILDTLEKSPHKHWTVLVYCLLVSLGMCEKVQMYLRFYKSSQFKLNFCVLNCLETEHGFRYGHSSLGFF